MEQEHPKAAIGYILALSSGILSAAGTTIQKMAIPPSIDLTLEQIREIVSDPFFMLLIAGIGITFLSTCLVAFSFKFGRSNVLFSMMGGTCSIGIVLLPFLFLHEKISTYTLIGMLIIVAGVALMGLKFTNSNGKNKRNNAAEKTPRANKSEDLIHE